MSDTFDYNEAPDPDEQHYPASAVDAPSGALQRWADVAMWKAPEHTDPQKPKVTVSMCTPDPLGVMAMVNAQYTGRNLTSPSQVNDEERREAWHAATVSKLSETPLEWIQWSINFENVSRAFTHQLVRTRMATYAQESQRFAVKGALADAVKLPPTLAGTAPSQLMDPAWWETDQKDWDYLKDAEKMRSIWDTAVAHLDEAVNKLINMGMPAEDARGLLPTNVLTRVHMRVDMRTLIKLAGLRLCTQAQAEWRMVFAELAKAIRSYGPERERWQMELIASSFRPVCWAANHCPMKAKSDRFCEIRGDVDRLASAGIPSSEWDGVIHPARWVAADAARVAPGQTR